MSKTESWRKHCNTLQHTATHCNTLEHTGTHCNTLQNTAKHCNATHCNTLQHTGEQIHGCRQVCCSVLQCVAVFSSWPCLRHSSCTPSYSLTCVLQCAAVCCSVLQCVAGFSSCTPSYLLTCVLQCVAVRCSVLQCVAVCCSVLQCFFHDPVFDILHVHPLIRSPVCCNVLRCVAVCCSVFFMTLSTTFFMYTLLFCSPLLRSPVCCSVLQCVAVFFSCTPSSSLTCEKCRRQGYDWWVADQMPNTIIHASHYIGISSVKYIEAWYSCS